MFVRKVPTSYPRPTMTANGEFAAPLTTRGWMPHDDKRTYQDLLGGFVTRTRRQGQRIPILNGFRWDAENLLELLRLHPVVIRFQEYPGLGVELQIVQC